MLIGISTIDLNWFYSLPRLQLVPLAILSMDISQIPWEEIPIPGYKHKRCPGISGINGDIFRCRYMFVRPLGILMSSVELQEISQIPWEDILMCGYKHKRSHGISGAIWRYILSEISQIPWEDILMCGYKHKRAHGFSGAIWRYIMDVLKWITSFWRDSYSTPVRMRLMCLYTFNTLLSLIIHWAFSSLR